MPLLTRKPHIDPDYKSADLELAEGWENADGIHVQAVNISLSESKGGRLALILSKEDGEGGWTALSLTSTATERLRRYLNQAHVERTTGSPLH